MDARRKCIGRWDFVGSRAVVDVSIPHFLLFDASREDAEAGHCRFVLRNSDGSQRLEAEANEPGVTGERLALLSIARGLEALDNPSQVLLITPSSYVREGIRRGLSEWRNNGWRWERFGQMVPVKNLDLWQRVDRAMQFHQVDCRMYRIDSAHSGESEEAVSIHPDDGDDASSGAALGHRKDRQDVYPASNPLQYCYRFGRLATRFGRWMHIMAKGWINWIRRLGCARPFHWTKLDN
jgi:ribonuclease HI